MFNVADAYQKMLRVYTDDSQNSRHDWREYQPAVSERIAHRQQPRADIALEEMQHCVQIATIREQVWSYRLRGWQKTTAGRD